MLRYSQMLFTALTLLGSIFAASTDAPAFSERGKLLLSDDFSTPSPAWTGKVGDWQVADGVATATEKASDHHQAVRRHSLKYHDGIFEFSFRFDRSEEIALMLDEKSAHVCL